MKGFYVCLKDLNLYWNKIQLDYCLMLIRAPKLRIVVAYCDSDQTSFCVGCLGGFLSAKGLQVDEDEENSRKGRASYIYFFKKKNNNASFIIKF